MTKLIKAHSGSIKKANDQFMFGIFNGSQQMYYLFFREDRGKFKLLTGMQFTSENHFRPKYVFVEKTARGSKQSTFIPTYPVFLLDKIKVVDKVFLDQVPRVRIIVIGKQKTYFLNVIPDSTRGIPLSVQKIGKL